MRDLLKSSAFRTAAIVQIFFILLGIYFNYTSQDLLTRYTKEDGFIEWMTFLTFTVLAFFLFFVAWERKVRGEKLLTIKNLAVIALGFLFLFGSLEEISWYQRIADIEASDFFLQHNKQAETNFHNLKIGDVGINKLVFGKILFLFLLVHNVVLPLVARKKTKVRSWIESKGLFLPPLSSVAIYLALVIMVEIFISHRREKEHLEVIGSIHYFVTIFLTYGLGYGYSNPIFTTPEDKRRFSLVFSFLLVLMIYISWILGNMSLRDFAL